MPRRCGSFAVSFLLTIGFAIAAYGQGNPRVVNFYNWSDYIDPKVIEDFTAETGIKVRYDTFDSNDILETKLLAGRTGYDLVVPTAYFLERQIKAGVFQKLDKTKLSNLGNVWDEISRRLGTVAWDPRFTNDKFGIFVPCEPKAAAAVEQLLRASGAEEVRRA